MGGLYGSPDIRCLQTFQLVRINPSGGVKTENEIKQLASSAFQLVRINPSGGEGATYKKFTLQETFQLVRINPSGGVGFS